MAKQSKSIFSVLLLQVALVCAVSTVLAPVMMNEAGAETKKTPEQIAAEKLNKDEAELIRRRTELEKKQALQISAYGGSGNTSNQGAINTLLGKGSDSIFYLEQDIAAQKNKLNSTDAGKTALDAITGTITANGATTANASKPSAYTDSKGKLDKSEVAPENAKDECAYSVGIDGKYRCKTTRGIIDGAKITNTVLQTAGGVAAQIQGANIQQKFSQNANQGELMKMTGKMQVKSGNTQMTIGGINSAIGVVQVAKALQHEKYRKQLDADYTSTTPATFSVPMNDTDFVCPKYEYAKNSTAQRILENNEKFGTAIDSFLTERHQICSNRAGEYQKLSTTPELKQANLTLWIKERDGIDKFSREQLSGVAKRITSAAIEEQNAIAADAAVGGFGSLTTGSALMLNGAANRKEGKMTQKLADSYQNAVNQQGLQPPVFDLNGNPIVPNSGGVITGSGDSNELAAAEEKQDEGGNDLAAPGNVLPPLRDPGGLGPMAGRFEKGGAPGGGGGGGGVPGLSPGSTSPDTSPRDEPQAQMASLSSKVPGSQYGQNAIALPNKGGSSGGGGGSMLNDLLAKFLPQEKKEETSILDMGKGGLRDLASAPEEDEGFSVLDKKANLFERIHETYQTKHRQGNIGL